MIKEATSAAVENTAPAANAALVISNQYKVKITGFTYIKDYALIKGKIGDNKVGIIIGDKMSFPMKEMFRLQKSGGCMATYKKDKEVNGTVYQQFVLDEILFAEGD
jgi:hypothetical protein